MNLVALIEIRMLNGENGLGILNVNTRVLRDKDRGRKIRGSNVLRCYAGGLRMEQRVPSQGVWWSLDGGEGNMDSLQNLSMKCGRVDALT